MEYSTKVYRSSQMSSKEIRDFIAVQRQVFTSAPMTEDVFSLKFQQNIYGDSILVIIYDSAGCPAAARAFWRNDIDGKTAYQPSDTAVCKEHRKQGLFGVMTRAALEQISPNTLIYNFPNSNSYPLYLKMGWKDFKVQYARLFTPWNYAQENSGTIDSDYLRWWIKPRTTDAYGYIHRMGDYYLIRLLNKEKRAIVFGKMEKRDAPLFPQVKPSLVIYHSIHRPFYVDRKKIGCHIVAYHAADGIRIPDWKTDVL